MGYDDRREILERLEALERMIARRDDRDRHDQRGGRHRDHRDRHDHCDHARGGHDHCGHDGGERDFDEKRVIDTIVHLVGEQVGRLLDERQPPARDAADGGGEKRIVDLIVGLVAEHVQEIVAAELDRRFGRAGGEPAAPPSPAAPEPS